MMKLPSLKKTLFALLATTLVAMLAACGGTSGTGAGGNTPQNVALTLYSSGDVNVQSLWKNTLIPQFEKSHPNITVNLVFAEHGTIDSTTLAKLSASVAAKKDPGMDVIDAGLIQPAAIAHLLLPITAQDVPLVAHVDPTLLQQVNNDGVPYRASSVVLAYNTQYVQDPPPTKLSDVLAWIKAHPGKFTYNTPNSGGSGHAFVEAVVDSHLTSDNLHTFVTGQDAATGYNTTVETAWQAGLQELHSLNPSIYRNGFYPNGNTAVLQLLGNGSISMAPVWSDQALTALSQKQLPASVKLTQLDPPLNGGPAYLGIPVNTTHPKEAYELVNWVLGADVQATIISAMHGFPGVQWSYVPPEVQQQYASIAHAYGTGFSSKFSADLNKQWQTQVAAS